MSVNCVVASMMVSTNLNMNLSPSAVAAKQLTNNEVIRPSKCNELLSLLADYHRVDLKLLPNADFAEFLVQAEKLLNNIQPLPLFADFVRKFSI